MLTQCLKPRYLATALLFFCLSGGTAFADQIVRKYPAGSAEDLLKKNQDPEWKKREDTQALLNCTPAEKPGTQPMGTGACSIDASSHSQSAPQSPAL